MIVRRRLLTLIGAASALSPFVAASAGAPDSEDPQTLYQALERQPDASLSVGGGRIDVVFAEGAPGVDRARTLAWVRQSAVAVTFYFGRFPVRKVGILIEGQEGERVGHATTFGLGQPAIRIHVGRSATDPAFAEDWVLVHEMVHLALPSMPRESLWIQEGNAVYVEPIARAQAGQITDEVVWKWSLKGMPTGLPRAGDRGLDHTQAHDRIYWGGAIFWLLADVAIDQQSRGAKSLRDALRAVNRASGGNVTDWTPDQLMASGDAAVGGDALRQLYAEMKDTPVSPDLAGLFARLGVGERDGVVVFDDSAPLAALRRRLTRPLRV
jgi:hypothetical protein